MNDPRAQFSTPEAVIEDSSLTRKQKIRILEDWEYDERNRAVAVEEGMTNRETTLLPRILHALDSLRVGARLERGSPSKQGGL